MKRLVTTRAPAMIVLALLLVSGVLAQSGGPFNMSRWRVAGGGATFSSGGQYTVGGTLGQHEAGLMQGGPYALGGGFWVVDATPTPGDTPTPPKAPSPTPARGAYMPLIQRPMPPTFTPTPRITPTPPITPTPVTCNEIEPDNDKPKKAPPLTSVGQTCGGSFDNVSGDTVDLYKITLVTQTTIALDLTNIPTQGDDTLALYDEPFGSDENRKPICLSKQPGQANEHIVLPNAAPGTYYIGVFLAHRSPVAPDTYLLRAAFEDKPAACTPP